MIKKLNANAKKIDNFLNRYFKKQINSNLLSPMIYGTISGGKKIRSTIIFNTGKIFGVNNIKLFHICAAVELIHSYSLIHDDLPCMDNDRLRRGKPTTHIKFGESTAVLAGSSLLTMAFEILTENKFKVSEKSKNDLIKNLAACSGHTGVAGGQELDLRYERKKKSFKQITQMQRKKTGQLFKFCCYAPCLIANRSISEKKNMSKLGEDIGLLFQLADDFLDIKGSKKKVGKSLNKDNKKGKSTLIKLIGYNKAILYAENLKTNILRRLRKYGKKANDLTETINFILERNI